eukprot:TRINITY_DN1543_c0_g1_i6.p1 TRINITY_DN1543_c0_g1~~TRINITY_DN1543_c0_g1_i6.p1  ORF type:complete len:207 (+),score=44.52 TRINITY_DN1543_c0_g1_i6:128-748(+)
MKIVLLVLIVGLAVAQRTVPYHNCFSLIRGILDTSVQQQTYVYRELERNQRALTDLLSNISFVNHTCKDFIKVLQDHRRSGVYVDKLHSVLRSLNDTTNNLRNRVRELIENGPTDIQIYYINKVAEVKSAVRGVAEAFVTSIYYRFIYIDTKYCQDNISVISSFPSSKSALQYLEEGWATLRACDTLSINYSNPKMMNLAEKMRRH